VAAISISSLQAVIQRQRFLNTAGRRDLFVTVLERVRKKYQFVLVGYVIMPEHFRLLISEPEKANPSVLKMKIRAA